MDLAPGRSFLEWAVQHGHTVFVISYRDADESMANTSMEDYLKALVHLDAEGEVVTNRLGFYLNDDPREKSLRDAVHSCL
jgi:poly(3-hydroxyalkanoate) synthetase